MATSSAAVTNRPWLLFRSNRGLFIMAVLIPVMGVYLFAPIAWIFAQTFNVSGDPLIGEFRWGLSNWTTAFSTPAIWKALWNTVMVWFLTAAVSFPTAVGISWLLGRTRIPMSNAIEVMFWISYMMPNISTTIAWVNLMDPDRGLLNVAITALPFIDKGPFNIFSVPGIVWAGLMANGISFKVMLLTPTFRNMDASLEEAGRVSGASNLGVLMRITLPAMASPMILVLGLQLVRIFQSFEIEQILGTPFGFFVYSTLIFQLIRSNVDAAYGQASALAGITILVVALIIPLQRWIIHRRLYTTLSSGFRPSLIDLGRWKWVAFGGVATLILLLTVFPFSVLILGSFMFRSGYFHIRDPFTLDHWNAVLFENEVFAAAIRTTLLLAVVAAVLSPLLFSMLAYVIVRTRWPGRSVVDIMIWTSSAVPGILSGLGLLVVFLAVPGLNILYGTIWALFLVVIIQGNTSGVNLSKAAIVQIGQEMEDAGRIAGAGWLETYIRIWLPLMMPTLLMLGILNFVMAAGATSSIILLASRGTTTLSIMALELASPSASQFERASIVAIILTVLTVGIALIARHYGLLLGVRQR